MQVAARTRADVDICSEPKVGASILDRIPTDCPVEILENLNGWFKIKPGRLLHGISGYLPQAALVFPVETRSPVFPLLMTADGLMAGTSVPSTLKVTIFLQWLAAKIVGKPDWILESIWASLNNEQRSDLLGKIRAASIEKQPHWNDWIEGLRKNLRFEEAEMNEWIVMLEGGRDVYAIRDHYVYMYPVQDTNYFGCALKGQIMRWSGAVCCNDQGGERRNFYEVEFYRMSRYMRGWFRADIAADYQFPSPNLDPAIESNAQTVFDLTKKILQHPQDQAITDAKNKGYSADQYINVYDATKKQMVHFSLCGEFCVAALSGMDVLPLLKAWLKSNYWRAPAILGDPQEGTGIDDLKSLLTVVGLRGEIYTSIPTTPQRIKARLASGQFVIAGCGINSGGKIKADGKIRHWVILEDVLPSGNSGWVRVYNPFYNQEEVYNYTLFMTSLGVGAGLWILPAH